MLQLVIANRNYSSWSLRAWLYLVESGIPFDEIRIPLFTAQWKQEIEQYSPGGWVPVLVDDGFSIWDSAAIIEYVKEQYPEAIGWPEGREHRARARSYCAEMHSGFLAPPFAKPTSAAAWNACAATLPDRPQGELMRSIKRGCPGASPPSASASMAAAMSWMQRLKRVFAVDIETCPEPQLSRHGGLREAQEALPVCRSARVVENSG